MRFVFYTNSVSPHQLPLAREIVRRLGPDDYCYIYTSRQTLERRRLGWGDSEEKWIVSEKERRTVSRNLLETCDMLMCGIRDFDLIDRRTENGLKTIYVSERWFKPIPLSRLAGSWMVYLPGWLRLFHPRYFKYAKRVARLLSGENGFRYYAMGVWAKRDMELICKVFRVPDEKRDLKLRLWGYFVEPSQGEYAPMRSDAGQLRILWVGRMIYWKRVDTLIRAVAATPNVVLDLYGIGPMESEWRRLAERLCARNGAHELVRFHPAVPLAEVRQLMRTHDAYVMPSNGEEGWGAAVNEALEEGLYVIGTHEAGSSATILPPDHLFHAGDWRTLSSLVKRLKESPKEKRVQPRSAGDWTPKHAAEKLMEELG